MIAASATDVTTIARPHLALVESGGPWTFYIDGKNAGDLAASARAPEFRFNPGSLSIVSAWASTAFWMKPASSPSPPVPFR